MRRLRAAARTVRGRTTAAAMLMVGLASILGAVSLVLTLQAQLEDELAKSIRLRVTDVAEQVVASMATADRLPPDLDVTDPDDEFVQILDRTGAVVAASTNVTGQPAQGRLSDDPVEITGPLPESPLMLVSGVADTAQGEFTVLVGHSMDSVSDATQAVAWLLAVGLPVMLVVIAVAGWVLTGRALAPVEAIRDEVELISSARLDQRVPEPVGQDEIARLARTMNDMLDRLEQAARRQRRFVADASHELRSPVAAIRQHAEVSAAHPARYSSAELSAAVLGEALRIQRLVDDLLLLARADEQALGGRREPLDLDDLVFAEAARLRTTTTLRVDTAAVSAGRVDADADHLRRLLRNLVDNAARHATGCVRLGLSEHDERVLLTVEDDGPGIPAADRERVLLRFVRLDEARARDNGGSGLGLAIVAELARAHDAELRLGDSPLGGVRVRLGFRRSNG